jgi:hypothetical protein
VSNDFCIGAESFSRFKIVLRMLVGFSDSEPKKAIPFARFENPPNVCQNKLHETNLPTK